MRLEPGNGHGIAFDFARHRQQCSFWAGKIRATSTTDAQILVTAVADTSTFCFPTTESAERATSVSMGEEFTRQECERYDFGVHPDFRDRWGSAQVRLLMRCLRVLGTVAFCTGMSGGVNNSAGQECGRPCALLPLKPAGTTPASKATEHAGMEWRLLFISWFRNVLQAKHEETDRRINIEGMKETPRARIFLC